MPPIPRRTGSGFEPYVWAATVADVAARHRLSPAHVLRFDANLPPFAARLPISSRRALANRGEYPEGSYRELRKAAATYAGCTPEEIVVDAGADGLIGLVARTFLSPGRRAVTERRTYPLYAIATRLEGAEVEAAPRELDALAAAASTAAVLWLCNPGNPGGELFAAREIAELARELPATLVCVDEAYYEYGGETAAPAALEVDNLVCVRTLSKAFGLAGLRVGYGVAAPRIAAELSARRSPAPIPTSSAALATAALQPPEIEPEVRATRAERERVRAAFIAAGFDAPPTHTNFVVVRTPQAAAIAGQLEHRGLVVRAYSDFNIATERERIRDAIKKVRANLGRKHPLIINNEPVPTSEWTPSRNPADQKEIVGYVARATITEAERALEAAGRAQQKWARVPVEERAALLRRLAVLLKRDKSELNALEILEAGKSWTEADADVAEAIDFCNFYAVEMRTLGQPKRTQRVAGESNRQHWWPRGVGVVIAPWNFPLAILTGMMSAAIVAGNAVIIKPSEQTSVIAARLMELLIESGLPAGVVNFVSGRGSEVGAHLVAHPKVDFVAFTGSKEVGLKIWETAGRTAPGQMNLKKVVCEMGGKNCVIVDGDADLDEAVLGVVQSAFGYQGQKCSALSRLIVLADNYDRFLGRLIAATESLRVGPAEEPGAMIGPVIDRQAQQRILEMIEVGRKEAKLAWMGKVPEDANSCYVSPTIFTDVTPGCRIFREEIFGPVLAVTKASDFAEALALANDCEFALTGGCYSRSPANIERVKNEMMCGNVYINRPITGAIVERQPFGGFRMSGGGTKAGGGEYLQHFLAPRVITENCLRRGFAPADEE